MDSATILCCNCERKFVVQLLKQAPSGRTTPMLCPYCGGKDITPEITATGAGLQVADPKTDPVAKAAQDEWNKLMGGK